MLSLKKLGYTQLESCKCSFKFEDDVHEVIILVYEWEKEEMKSLFKLKNLRVQKSYMEFLWSK